MTELQYDADKLMQHARENINSGHLGEAKDLVRSSAMIYKEKGQVEKAVKAHLEFAGAMLSRQDYGWARSAYYYAAMVYIEVGRLDNALDELKKAAKKLSPDENKDASEKLKRRIEILENPEFNKMQKLDYLAEDFRRDRRDSWERSCKRGMDNI